MNRKYTVRIPGKEELRRRAEGLVDPSSISLAVEASSSVEKLREEIGIFNIELELQCEELRQARKKVEESQRYLADLFEFAPVAYVVLNKDGRIQDLNAKAADVFGMTKNMLRGQRLLSYVPHTNLLDFSRCLKVLLDKRLPQTCEVAFRLPHGESLDSRVQLLFLDNPSHKDPFILCAMEDISMHRQAQKVLSERNYALEELVKKRTQELEELNAQLREENALRMQAQEAAESSNLAKSQFLANMSHEIRTPLSGVLGMMNLMEIGELNSKQRQFLKVAQKSGWTLLQLINDVLDFSKIEAGQLKLIPEPLDLHAFAKDIHRLFFNQAKEKGLLLSMEVDPSIPTELLVDKLRLEQVLANLLGNAIKFTEEGVIRVVFTKVLDNKHERQTRVHILIQDTCSGIPESKLKSVFEPFTQVDGSYNRHHSGTGLGLGIVQRLIKIMGGRVRMESQLNQGTSVHCSIPFAWPPSVQPEPAPAVVPEEEPFTPKAGNANGRISGLRILLAEDTESNILYAETVLKGLGCDVTLAHNGLEALDLLRLQKFDVVLMDIQMPVLDGLEATRRIRANEDGSLPKHIPIIALTAHAIGGDEEKCLEAGANAYLSKPFEIEDFLRIITQALGKS